MKFVVIALVVSLFAIEASAYSLYKTSSGKNIRWTKSTIEVVLDTSMATLATKESVEKVVRESFELWVIDASLPISFVVVWDECKEAHDDSNNCIIACHKRAKCYDRPQEKGGTTFINVSPSTGAIHDADIVLNADDWMWSVDGSNEHGLDLFRVMVHEIGHFIGIDHSEEKDAIMYPSLLMGEHRAVELDDDDILAGKTLYADFVEMDESDNGAVCSIVHVGERAGHGGGFIGLFLIGIAIVGLVKFRGR